jgi:hypothetical protein
MRRFAAWLGLAFLLVVVPVGFVLAVLAPGVAEAASCQPAITSIRTQASSYFGQGRIDITGRCFGTATRFAGEDRSYLRISNLGVNGALPNSSWNACWTGDPGTDAITCDVSEWTDTHIRFDGFTGAYGSGGYLVSRNDNLAFQVWNAQTGAGPTIAFLRGGAAGTVPAAATHNPHMSAIARALASPTDAFSSVSADVVNASIAVAAALFITFPANLFNQTFEENYADIRAWWRKRFRWLLGDRVDDATAAGEDDMAAEHEPARDPKTQPAAFATVVIGGAFLGGLLDPEFGANLRSVLNVFALALAICAGIVIPMFVAQGFYRASGSSARLQVRALPAGLAIAAACVLLSRLSGFQPGYLYGVVAGVVLGRSIGKREQAHLIVMTTLAVIAASVVAWIAWAGINGSAQEPGANDALVLLDDALAAMFVAGLVGSVISMLPLRFLPGDVLKSWNSRIWAAVFTISLFGLIQVMLRPHATDEGPSHSPLVTTLTLFALFAAGTVVFRWHFVHKRLLETGEQITSWRQAVSELLGDAAAGPTQLAATTDGVAFVDVSEKVVDLTAPRKVAAPQIAAADVTAPEVAAPEVAAPEVAVPAQRAERPKRTTASKT